ncbi:MAG: TRAP transporter large permease [Candidatus Goldiibacteriota bacterium]
MTAVIIGLVVIGFAVIGTPLFVILGGLAMLLFAMAGIDIAAVIIEATRISTSPVLIAIPLFTFAGYLMAESDMPKRTINLIKAFLGWMRGGIALVALVAATFFTAFTGATGVTIIALGGLLYPMLKEEKYSEKFTLGMITTSGSLGLLFPPSIVIILYGLIAEVNITQLFVAGIIPGAIMVILAAILAMKEGRRVEAAKKVSGRAMISAVKDAAWEIPLPLVVIGGIYSGMFTAAEAAVITAAYILIVEVFIYRDLKLRKDVPRIARSSIVLTGGIFVILGSALGLTSYLVDEQVPMKMLEWIREHIHSKIVFLLMLNILLILVGCLMDIFSAIIIIVPLIAPIAEEFGIHPVHLGIIFLTNLGIGYMTPPVGLSLFISSFRFRKPIVKLYSAVLPFLVVMLVGLILVTYIPELSLYLLDVFNLS